MSLMLAGCAAAVRLLAALAGLATLAAHHRLVLVLVLVCLVLVGTVTVTGVIGHLYMLLTFFIKKQKARNLTQPYLQYAHPAP
jgi:hypothetical protein